MVSIYWVNKMLDSVLDSTALYAGLSSTPADRDGTGYTEPFGGGYTRPQVPGFTRAIDGEARNSSAVHFPTSSATWFSSENKAAYWLLFDGQGMDANLLACGQLGAHREIEPGVSVTIPSDSLSIALMDLGDTMIIGGNAYGAVLYEYGSKAGIDTNSI